MAHLLNHFFPDNKSFGFEALRAAGYANCGGADIGEVIAICSRIPSGNEDVWLQEWKAAGDRALTNANISLAIGNTPGAKEAFLRASNYYRTADFYRRENPSNDELSNLLADSSCNSFYKAASLMSYITQKVRIPYEGTTLPGILMRSDATDEPRPLIVINGGFDSTMEEVVYSIGGPALELGMNVLAFDGPGQGSTIRKQNLVFRHDWEHVITPVVDYAIAQPFVDKSKLALMGISLGGYLAARASAYEHRFAAIILNDGIFDFGGKFRRNPKEGDINAGDVGDFLQSNEWDDKINGKIREAARQRTGFKWAVANGKWVFGLDSEVEVIRQFLKFTLEGIVEQIQTPTLVLDAPDDHFMNGQPKELYRKLKCYKTLIALTEEEGASLHCHVGAASRLGQITMDWLLQNLAQAST